MDLMKYIVMLLVATDTAGCAALFGPSTNDPAVHLKWASENFNSLDRPVKAEEQLWGVIETYKKERNQLCLAEAYRQSALFLRSNRVDKFAITSRKKALWTGRSLLTRAPTCT
jgi:hypothetical protein